jgi:hypothetical protein
MMIRGTQRHLRPFDRVDAAWDERNERGRLRDEARYRRERFDLYRARMYGGRAGSQAKLRELQGHPTVPLPVFAGRKPSRCLATPRRQVERIPPRHALAQLLLALDLRVQLGAEQQRDVGEP